MTMDACDDGWSDYMCRITMGGVTRCGRVTMGGVTRCLHVVVMSG